jgi:hypothetical protein
MVNIKMKDKKIYTLSLFLLDSLEKGWGGGVGLVFFA